MTNNEVRSNITQMIVDAVQKGCPPWRQPWGNHHEKNPGLPRNFVKQRRYNGINILVLMHAMNQHGFYSPLWGTEKQWGEIGGKVKIRPHHVPGGKWGTDIVIFYQFAKEAISPVPNVKSKTLLGMRAYTVYNLDQVEALSPSEILALPKKKRLSLAYRLMGKHVSDISSTQAIELHKLSQKRLALLQEPITKFEVFPEAERVLFCSEAYWVHGEKAVYHADLDYIEIPYRHEFDTPNDYYLTSFHELVHWSEHKDRIGKSPKHRDTKESYAFSELVAEIGACLLAAELGINVSQDLFPGSLSYVKHWLDQMGSDPKFIFEAAFWSGKIVDYLLKKCQPVVQEKCYV